MILREYENLTACPQDAVQSASLRRGLRHDIPGVAGLAHCGFAVATHQVPVASVTCPRKRRLLAFFTRMSHAVCHITSSWPCFSAGSTTTSMSAETGAASGAATRLQSAGHPVGRPALPVGLRRQAGEHPVRTAGLIIRPQAGSCLSLRSAISTYDGNLPEDRLRQSIRHDHAEAPLCSLWRCAAPTDLLLLPVDTPCVPTACTCQFR